MRKVLIILVALFAMAAFASGVVAQGSRASVPAAEKPFAVNAMRAFGTVSAYEAGKTITVKGKKEELTFDIAPDAKIKGEVKEGVEIRVMYKKEGDKMTATSIEVPTKKAKKKAMGEKKAE